MRGSLEIHDGADGSRPSRSFERAVAAVGEDENVPLRRREIRVGHGVREGSGLGLLLGEVRRQALQRGLALGCDRLAPLDGSASQLDGTEFLLANSDVALLRAHAFLASRELERELRQVGVPLVELGGSLPQHLLDRGAELPGAFFAPFEVGDRRLELVGVLLDLASRLLYPSLDSVRVVGCGEKGAKPVPNAFVVFQTPTGPVLPIAVASWILVHRRRLQKGIMRRRPCPKPSNSVRSHRRTLRFDEPGAPPASFGGCVRQGCGTTVRAWIPSVHAISLRAFEPA